MSSSCCWNDSVIHNTLNLLYLGGELHFLIHQAQYRHIQLHAKWLEVLWSILSELINFLLFLQEYCKNLLCCKHFLWNPESVWWAAAWRKFTNSNSHYASYGPINVFYLFEHYFSHLMFLCIQFSLIINFYAIDHFHILLWQQLEQKQKYAAWKAADISKALKEGRKPLPGPPGGDNDLTLPSRTSSDEYVWYLDPTII